MKKKEQTLKSVIAAINKKIKWQYMMEKKKTKHPHTKKNTIQHFKIITFIFQLQHFIF